MKKLYWIIFLLGVGVNLSLSQVYVIPQFALDSAVKHTFKGEVSAMFRTTYTEQFNRVFGQFTASSALVYVSQKHDYRIMTDWYADTGVASIAPVTRWSIFSGVSINKYRIVGDKLRERRFVFSPIYVYQKNTDRGLIWRHQVGGIVKVFGYKTPKLWFSLSPGLVMSVSNWALDEDDYLASAGLSDMDSHNLFFSNLQPVVLMNLYIRLTPYLNLDASGYTQFLTRNPHPHEVLESNPDLKVLYPKVVLDINLRVTVNKNLSLQGSLRSDFERTRPTLSRNGFEWFSMVGVNWKFTVK